MHVRFYCVFYYVIHSEEDHAPLHLLNAVCALWYVLCVSAVWIVQYVP